MQEFKAFEVSTLNLVGISGPFFILLKHTYEPVFWPLVHKKTENEDQDQDQIDKFP